MRRLVLLTISGCVMSLLTPLVLGVAGMQPLVRAAVNSKVNGVEVFYVDKDNVSGVEDGLSWATAFSTIQAAVNAAAVYGIYSDVEVWVAEGVYGELRDPAVPYHAAGSIVMREGVDLYGGFTGSETKRPERDWQAHESILDGSAARGGQPAYHVIIGADNTTLDGFVVVGGHAYADGLPPWPTFFGGGMFNDELARCTIANCTFRDNFANWDGGGLFSTGDPCQVINCLFTGNTAGSIGGGMHCAGASNEFTVTGCTFTNNAALGGGAMGVQNPGVFDIAGCVFVDNRSELVAGAVQVYDSAPTLINCLFVNNTCDGVGGAINAIESTPWIVNCTFWGNTATEGGAIHSDQNCITTLLNSIIWGNSEDQIFTVTDFPSYPGSGVEFPSETRVASSDVQSGYPGEGNIDADPLFRDPMAGDLRLSWSSPCIDAVSRIYRVYAPDTDLLGVPRPRGRTDDMGAYEFMVGDEDGDGMDDSWELENGFDPTDPTDGEGDADGDGVSNMQEFHLGTDPNDPGDPPSDLYVATTGSDDTGDGTLNNPRATIGRAMQDADRFASATHPVTIHVGAGTYDWSFFDFVPYVAVEGEDRDTTIIRGSLSARDEGTALRHCTIAYSRSYVGFVTLVRVVDASIEIRDVKFDGAFHPYSVGVFVSGQGSSESVISECLFTGLETGLWTSDSGVLVSDNEFRDIAGNAVFVQPPPYKEGEESTTPLLGRIDDPRAPGLNTFRDVDGFFVKNTAISAVWAQNNDWGVYTAAAIEAKISGDVIYEPFVGGEQDVCCFVPVSGTVRTGGRISGDLLLLLLTMIAFMALTRVPRRREAR